MNHRDPPPPPPLPPPNIRHYTTPQILKQTTSLICSHLLTFLFLSSLLLTFRSNVQSASYYLSSLIDSDPSLKSLLTRLDFSASSHFHHHPRHPLRQPPYRRRRAFLHLSRVGTLDDDFFSGDSDFDRSLFHPSSRKPAPNATFVILSDFHPDYGFSNSVIDNGISFPEIVKPGGVGFKPEFRKNTTLLEEEEKGFLESRLDDNTKTVLDLDFLIKGFELGNRDVSSLVFLAGVLSAAYAYVVLAFIVTYTWVNGIIFLKVVDHLVGNYRSFFRTVWEGSNIGLKRLSGFILMKWAVRDALAQLMGIFFFGEIEDQYVFFKVFLRMKFMPFANVAPWVIGHEWESAGFMVIWFLSDLIFGLIFAVDSWVAIVDSRRGGREIVKEGCHILVALFYPAFEIRWLEAVLCGSLGKWLMRRIFGDFFTLIFQSLMEVFFMVAWLVFYLAARHRDDTALGRTFGRRELEGLLDIAR